MKRALVCAGVALLALSASADLVTSNGRGDSIRLKSAPCTSEVILPMIREEHRASFKAGSADISGKSLAVCWIDTQDGAYVMFFENGEFLMLPIAVFAEGGV